MGAQSDVLKQQLSNMTAAKEVDDEQILSLQSLLKQANDEIERLKGLLADMTAAKNASDARISTLEGQSRDDADKMASLRKQVSELEDVLHRTREEMAIMTTKYTDMTTSSAAANEEIVDLKRQLSDLQISSSRSLVDLQAQLQSSKDELTAFADKHADLMALHATASKQVETLIAQGKDDSIEITNVTTRASELEIALKERDEKLAALTVAHAAATAASAAAMAVAERTIAEWETTCKKKDIEIASLTDQQTNLRASSAAATNEAIEALKTELSTLETSSSQSVTDLQTQLKSARDELTAFAVKHADLAALHAIANKRVESLIAQGKDDSIEITNVTARASALEIALKERDEKLAVLTITHADAIAEWETTCKKKDIEITSLTDQQTNLRASSEAAANEAIEALKTQLSALETSSSTIITDLQAQNRKSNDDAAVLTQRFNDLTAAKAAVDEQVEALQVKSKKDMNDLMASSSATMAGTVNQSLRYHPPRCKHAPS